MNSMPAAAAKSHFGALLDRAQSGPVTISKNGRAVAVVMSMQAFDEHQEARLRLLRHELGKGLADLDRGAVVSSVEAFNAFDRELGDA